MGAASVAGAATRWCGNCGNWCITLLHLCIILGVSVARRDDLIVNTEKGRLRGIRYYLPNLSMAVDAYLGIPFAKPPVGHLRFRHPQPLDPWQGIYNATKLPNSCYQAPDVFFDDFRGSTMWNPTTRVSEDCLYLNVWVPKTTPRIRRSAVFVWIYGGGFYSGTTTLNIYDGKILAAMNSIIVVSIGYRVGALGFMAMGHASAPGNAGMFDQLMGLEWVQQNIRYFGGDPNNVTLFGESAGSVSVSLHLLSPLSRSKFHRAIMQSGTANMPWGTLTMHEAKRRSMELVSILDCDKSSNTEAIVDCMRRISPQKLVEEQWVSRGVMQFPFLPVIDGAFLIEQPEVSLRRKSFKKCPVLLGSNLNEGSFFIIYELSEWLTLDTIQMSELEFQKSIDMLFFTYPQYPQRNNEFGLDAIAYQYTNWLEGSNHRKNVNQLDNSVGDCHFTCHVNHFAYTYASAGENVYMYYFTQRYSSNPWPEWMGVLHGDEIVFTFGEPFKPGLNYTDAERELSRQVMMYWTNFAKTGDPNRAPGRRSLNEWPLHSPHQKQFLELNVNFLHQADKSRAIGRGPRAKQCAFWKEYLPELVRKTSKHTKPEPPRSNATCQGSASHVTGSKMSTRNFVCLVVLAWSLMVP